MNEHLVRNLKTGVIETVKEWILRRPDFRQWYVDLGPVLRPGPVPNRWEERKYGR